MSSEEESGVATERGNGNKVRCCTTPRQWASFDEPSAGAIWRGEYTELERSRHRRCRSLLLEDTSVKVSHCHWNQCPVLISWQTYGAQDRCEQLKAVGIDSSTWRRFANKARELFTSSGDSSMIDFAVLCEREALLLHPPGDPDRTTSLDNLACTLHTRYKSFRESADLQESIDVHREALLLDRGFVHLHNLANSLRSLYESSREVISLRRESLQFCPPGHPSRAALLYGFAEILRTQLETHLETHLEISGDYPGLEEAIVALREAVALGHPDKWLFLGSLADLLFLRYELSLESERTDLEKSISLRREALLLIPSGHADQFVCLNNLAVALLARHQLLLEDVDLEEALHWRASQLDPPIGHSLDKWTILASLALGLDACYRSSGKLEVLDEAIFLHREILQFRPPGHLAHPQALDNLAVSLQTRYKMSGKLSELDESTLLLREAVQIDHPHRCSFLDHLASALFTRYELSGEQTDLTEASDLYRESLSISPKSSRASSESR